MVRMAAANNMISAFVANVFSTLCTAVRGTLLLLLLLLVEVEVEDEELFCEKDLEIIRCTFVCLVGTIERGEVVGVMFLVVRLRMLCIGYCARL